MSHDEIVSRLTQLAGNPTEVLFSITMQRVIDEIVGRMGIQALALTTEDLQMVKQEVLAALEHNLDEREYIDEGLDAWEIVRDL